MSLARVILHVGPPRTGSTSIQAALAACRRQLLEDGVYYPPTQPDSVEGQPSLAWDILAECGKPVLPLSQAYVSWEESLLGAERAGAHTLLVSSEDFCSDAFDGAAFLQLRRRLTRLPVHVVFGLRDPRRLVASIWSHSVRWGIGCGEEVLSLQEAAPLILSRSNVRVIEYLTTVENSLQPASIDFLTVPRRIDRAVVLKRFADSCGLPATTTAAILATADSTDRASTQNAALSLRYVLALLSINRAMIDRRRSPQCVGPEWLSNSIEVRRRLLEVIEKDAAGERPRRAALPGEYLSAAEDLGCRIVRWVKARSARVHGHLRDVWDEDEAFGDHADDVAPPSLTQAEINETALRYLAETAYALQGTIAEIENARDFWREEVTKSEERMTGSWSWRLTKPLRLAADAGQSVINWLHPRNE